jgi:hypothetical protein
MFGWMRRVVPLAASIVLLGVSGSAAGASVRLDLMPLPRSALGAGSAALARARDSGVVTNGDAAQDAGDGFTGAELAKRGRIVGYALDYVVPKAVLPQAGRALLGVKTMAELYRDPATASRGLAFWREVTRKRARRPTNGVTVSVSRFRANMSGGAFGFELTYRLAGKPLYYVGDIVFRSGRLLGSVFVSATDNIGLRARTLQFADSLAGRMQHIGAG